jgi:putative membrane protein
MDLSLDSIIAFVLPWKFSPTVAIVSAAAILVYVRGLALQWRAGERTGALRITAYFGGVLSFYALMQTRLDYWALHMFWMHRTQHAVLHHSAPFLIALSAPGDVLVRGTPEALRRRIFAPVWNTAAVRQTYNFIQTPVVATILFIGIMGFWLLPENHFTAMLSDEAYHAMNWSLVLNGLLFWWAMLVPSPNARTGWNGYGCCILLQWVVIMAMIAMGFIIMYSEDIIYAVYAICGRLWSLSPMGDQALGGMITWMPTTIVSVLAALVLLSRWMRESGTNRATDPGPGIFAKP